MFAVKWQFYYIALTDTRGKTFIVPIPCGDTPRKGFIDAKNAKVIYAKNAKAPKNLCDLSVTVFATFACEIL